MDLYTQYHMVKSAHGPPCPPPSSLSLAAGIKDLIGKKVGPLSAHSEI